MAYLRKSQGPLCVFFVFGFLAAAAAQDDASNDNSPSPEERKRRAGVLREADEARARYFLARKCTECKGTGSTTRIVKRGNDSDRVRSVCNLCNGKETRVTQLTLEAFDDYSAILGQLDFDNLAETRHFAFIEEAWDLLRRGGEEWAFGVDRTAVREINSQVIFIYGGCSETFGTKQPFVSVQHTPYGTVLIPMPPEANWKAGERIQVLCYAKRCAGPHEELIDRKIEAHLDVTKILKWEYSR